MILVVDDDRAALEQLETLLRGGGYDVVAVDRAEVALSIAADREPALVLSDLVMPEMDGFGFQQAYAARFPERSTPFMFLSSMSDDATVVQGLDAGAVDYLTKPASAPVLLAKVRATLRRKVAAAETVFRGDLASLPFCSVMRFCELKGLTGAVSIQSPTLDAEVRFRAGELIVDDDGDMLGALCDLTSGTFAIRSRPARFDDVEGIAPESPSVVLPTLLAGRLSTVEVGRRRLQVQTEVTGDETRSLVTLVTLDGQTLKKRVTRLAPGGPTEALQRQVDAQHHDVEVELSKRVEAARDRLSQPPEDPRARFNRLFDEGYELYRDGKLEAAVERWEEAQRLAPDNSTVRVNLEIARSKLASTASS